ncbi:MAG TPA: DUF3800 domain-containing protein [Patescibacteria group bacterium]
MRETRKKLYAYVDESGQDTKGLVFVVSVLVFEQEGENICNELEKIEKKSGKKNMKWNRSQHDCRKAYIEGILKLGILKGKIFFDMFSDTKKYIELTSFATAKAILKKTDDEEYKVTIFIDGFKKKEVEIFSRGLRDLRIKTKKIRGVKKDENNAFIRLVDAICGLVRDADEDNEWAKKSLAKLRKEKLVSEL